MEVHKHPHHVTHKKKWGEYLLEFFMLFLITHPRQMRSISAYCNNGFQSVDDVRDDRKSRRLDTYNA